MDRADWQPQRLIKTAQEIAFLPLDRVELAVLSACQTGLGKVAGGEGLIGIQRAFQVAGVRTTVASLWKVDDQATRKLMELFYTNLLKKEMSHLDALRDAQLYILNNPECIHGETEDSNRGKRAPKPSTRCRWWTRSIRRTRQPSTMGCISVVGRLAVNDASFLSYAPC